MRIIDADVFANELNQKILKTECLFEAVYLTKVRDMVNEQPTVDTMKHGKWRWVYDGIYDKDLRCSVCKKIPTYECRTKFCPNCGARMDGDSHE